MDSSRTDLVSEFRTLGWTAQLAIAPEPAAPDPRNRRRNRPTTSLVPSLPHEVLVELVRSRNDLVRQLVCICDRPGAIEIPADAIAESASIDLTQVAPTEYRADHITLFRDPQRGAICAVVVEIQRATDPDKRWTWPVYVTTARAALRCDVILLVLAPDPAVARWARAPIETGHPGFALRPLVLSFDDLPTSLDPEVARRLPELAVLAALAHPTSELALTALGAIRTLPGPQERLYCDLVMAALPETIRRALEESMRGYEYQSEFARKYVAQGREEGREEGLHEAVLALARLKLETCSPDDEHAIVAIHDPATLMRLTVALGEASSPVQARAALDAAVR